MSRISDGATRLTVLAMSLAAALLGSACEGLEGRNGVRQGNELFREMQFIDAAAAYQRSLQKVQSPIINYNLGLAYSKIYRPGYDKPIRLGEMSDPVCTDIPKTQPTETPLAICIKKPGASDQKDRRRFADCDEALEIENQLADARLAADRRQSLDQQLEKLLAEKDAQCEAIEQELAKKDLPAERREAIEDQLESSKDYDLCPASFECKRTTLCTSTSKQLANLSAENLQAWSKSLPSDEALKEQLAAVHAQQKAVQAQHEERMAAIKEEQKARRPELEKTLAELLADHEKRMARIKEEQKAAQPAFDAKLAKLRAEHDAAMAAIRQEQKAGQAAHDAALAKLKAEHEPKLAKLAAEHKERIATLKARHDKRLEKGNATPAFDKPAPPDTASDAEKKSWEEEKARLTGAREAKIRCFTQRFGSAERQATRRFQIAEGAEKQQYKDAESALIQRFKEKETKETQRYQATEAAEKEAFKESENAEVVRYKALEDKENQRFMAAENGELQRYKGALEPLAKRVDEITLKDDMRKQMTQAWIDTNQHDMALAFWQKELDAKPNTPQIMSNIAGIHLKNTDDKDNWRKAIDWFNKVADVESDPVHKVGALQSIGNITWAKLNSKTLSMEDSWELADRGLSALQKATEIQPRNGKLWSLEASILNFRSLTHGASFAAAIDRSNGQDLLKYARVLLEEAKKQPTPTPTPAPAPAAPAPSPTPTDTKPPAPTSPSMSGGSAQKTGG
jgi:hypothetical protein